MNGVDGGEGVRTDPVPSLRALVDGATAVLEEAGVPSAHHDALALAAHELGVSRVTLVLPPPLPPGFVLAYAALIDRRRRREPLQHIIGSTGFRYLELTVRAGVFVPRPETELVAEEAIDEARRVLAEGRVPLVVDLCCGAGPIGLSVADETGGRARVVMVDVEPAAVALTRHNAEVTAVGGVQVVEGDVRSPMLLAELAGQVDVLVSNPPYIPPDAQPIDPEVRDHDPDRSLYGGGPDGLDVPRAVVAAAARLLVPGGLLVVEHAEVQAEQLRGVAIASGRWTEVATRPDLTGRPRMLTARLR